MATGTCSIASNLVISYINQDTSHLSGTLKEFAKKQEIDEPMLLSMLRSLDPYRKLQRQESSNQTFLIKESTNLESTVVPRAAVLFLILIVKKKM